MSENPASCASVERVMPKEPCMMVLLMGVKPNGIVRIDFG